MSGKFEMKRVGHIPGIVSVRFYANDSKGHQTFANIIIIKHFSLEPTSSGPVIPGYNLFLLYGVIFIFIFIVTIQKRKIL